MADLSTIYTFFNNADAHAAFLHRIQTALVETALAVRAENEPDPKTDRFAARQRWARDALLNPIHVAHRLLPAIAVKANDAGRIDEQGNVTASDNEIRATVLSLVDTFADYVSA